MSLLLPLFPLYVEFCAYQVELLLNVLADVLLVIFFYVIEVN
jgi:hypothetical protein